MKYTYTTLTKYLLTCVNTHRGYNPDAKIVEWANNNGYDVDAEYIAIEELVAERKQQQKDIALAWDAYKGAQ